jgi:alkanesulfonate monooxygenase SsuD/methylene tetrahydromethanopterin reductase-like flavin-dependent oxidoreductase (luciferase family)
VVIANAAATLDELSGGRALIGIGAGGFALFAREGRPVSLAHLRESVIFIKDYMTGGDAEWRGERVHSEWVRKPVPIYIAATGPEITRLAGELSHGVISPGAHPIYMKWRLRRLREGAERAGRDPAQLALWSRTMIYVADSKEEARRDVSSYAATQARSLYFNIFRRPSPAGEELARDMEREFPGLIDECRKIYEAYDMYEHEKVGARHAELVSQAIIDFHFLTGRPEQICEQIEELAEIGVTNISTCEYAIPDKRGWIDDVGRGVVARFRARPAAPTPQVSRQGLQRRA